MATVLTPLAVPEAVATADRRQHERVVRPLDGVRVGRLELPILIYDLSEGGCCVSSMYDELPGVPLVLKIALPPDEWITVHAETLGCRPGVGFAARFTGMSEESRNRLERGLRKLRAASKPSSLK